MPPGSQARPLQMNCELTPLRPSRPAGQEAAKRLAELGEVRPMELDTASGDSIRRFADRVAEQHGGNISALVSCPLEGQALAMLHRAAPRSS